MSTYTKLLSDGRYEYDRVVIKADDRRKDRLEPVGIAQSYEEAVHLTGKIGVPA